MNEKTRVILIGVGSVSFSPILYLLILIFQVENRGATCSGKTTLAKHLNRILPDSVIIHQDVRVWTLCFDFTF